MRRSTMTYSVGLVLAAYVVSRSCAHAPNRKAPPPAEKPAAAATRDWSPEEMATDPEGYLKWADAQLMAQIVSREKALADLSARRKGIEQRQKELLGNLEEIESFHGLLARAVQRAEDEERWPAKVGGRSYERARAAEVLEQTKRYVADRRPLADDYRKALERMTGRAGAWREEIGAVARLRERLGLDLERVRLKQALPEIDALKRTEEEIAHYAKLLASMAEDPAEAKLSTGDLPAKQDLSSLVD